MASKYPTPFSKDAVFKKDAILVRANRRHNTIFEWLDIALFSLYFALLMLPSYVISRAELLVPNISELAFK